MPLTQFLGLVAVVIVAAGATLALALNIGVPPEALLLVSLLAVAALRLWARVR